MNAKIIKAKGYNIFIGNKVYNELSSLLQERFSESTFFIIVDENTKKHCLPFLLSNISSLKSNSVTLEIKSGEQHKTIDTAINLWTKLISHEAHRNSLIINLGGGVITDLGGFVASAFKRGIPFINIPTTLLSMVDASIGGKTGVDFEGIKNQIGFFKNPEAVFINSGFLETLPERELLSGYAEIIKHALIADFKYWQKLIQETRTHKQKTVTGWTEIIYNSVLIKNRIVKADPYEQNIRKKLNFGHTVGHAIESFSLLNNKSHLLHGEAVAIGMICEAYLSYTRAGLSERELEDIITYILSIYPKYFIKKEYIKSLIDFMMHDKKNKSKHINFTLLTDIGKSVIDQICSKDDVRKSFEYLISL